MREKKNKKRRRKCRVWDIKEGELMVRMMLMRSTTTRGEEEGEQQQEGLSMYNEGYESFGINKEFSKWNS